MWPNADEIRDSLLYYDIPQEDIPRALENYKDLKKGYIYYIQSTVLPNKELVVIPKTVTSRNIQCILLARSSVHWKGISWKHAKLKISWLRGVWKRLELTDLPCYFGMAYKSPLFENIISGRARVKFPILSPRKKSLGLTPQQLLTPISA